MSVSAGLVLTEEGFRTIRVVEVREHAHPYDGKLTDEETEGYKREVERARVVGEHCHLVI